MKKTNSLVEGHCPKCQGMRKSDIKATAIDSFNDGEIWGNTTYNVLECRGCGTFFVQTKYEFSEDYSYEWDPEINDHVICFNEKLEHWPSPIKREKPKWMSRFISLDSEISDVLSEIYLALNADLPILAAIGIRTAFDRSCELLKVDPALSFAEKLLRLVELGAIGLSEKEALHALAEMGNAAAHRAWKPDVEHLATMMSIFEGFLERNFILHEKAVSIGKIVPPRPKKLPPPPK